MTLTLCCKLHVIVNSNEENLSICFQALGEMKNFMVVNGEPNKQRQKLLRNLRIVELLVKLLQTPYRGSPDQQYVSDILVILVYVYFNWKKIVISSIYHEKNNKESLSLWEKICE